MLDTNPNINQINYWEKKNQKVRHDDQKEISRDRGKGMESTGNDGD